MNTRSRWDASKLSARLLKGGRDLVALGFDTEGQVKVTGREEKMICHIVFDKEKGRYRLSYMYTRRVWFEGKLFLISILKNKSVETSKLSCVRCAWDPLSQVREWNLLFFSQIDISAKKYCVLELIWVSITCIYRGRFVAKESVVRRSSCHGRSEQNF